MNTLCKTEFVRHGGTIVIPIKKEKDLSGVIGAIERDYGLPEGRIGSDFKGDFKEGLLLYGPGGEKVFLLGLGDKVLSANVIGAFRFFSFGQKGRIGSSVCVDFIHSNAENTSAAICWAVNGLMLGVYKIGMYKSENGEKHPLMTDESQLTVMATMALEDTERAVAKGLATAGTQRSMMDLVNAAPNYKTPTYLSESAKVSGEAYGYKVTVFDRKQCVAHGLHALVSVNDGSDHEPAFIIMEYQPKGKTEGLPKIGLVGKGVTFDTGGINIKPSANLWLMKSDMGGAAAVMGAMELTAKLQTPVHLIAIVAATENMTDGKSTKPGSVIQSFSGKTIEVIDTDAEGRLVLADGLAYMQKHYAPDVMIDLATLTGSIVSTLGYNGAGLFTNDEALGKQLLQAGETTGERLWNMPMWDIYGEDMKSDVADISNLSSKPVAGAITAAKFLENFIDGHKRWAHLDIAGMALSNSELGAQRTATGYGVRLLVEFIEGFEGV